MELRCNWELLFNLKLGKLRSQEFFLGFLHKLFFGVLKHDLVLFIHREDLYKEDANKKNNIADIIIAKHRNGPVGAIQLYFDAKTSSFKALENHRSEI